MKTIQEMARDCGINFHQAGWPELCRFAALVREEAQRKPLTYEEITAISKQVAEGGPNDSIDRFVRAIEAAHGIKE